MATKQKKGVLSLDHERGKSENSEPKEEARSDAQPLRLYGEQAKPFQGNQDVTIHNLRIM